MGIYVRYNGGRVSEFGCTRPNSLQQGDVYEVSGREIRGRQKNFCLTGIKGSYDSSWFQEVPTYRVIAHDIPKIGQSLSCYRIKFITREQPEIEHITTSPVRHVYQNESGTFIIETQASVYIVWKE